MEAAEGVGETARSSSTGTKLVHRVRLPSPSSALKTSRVRLALVEVKGLSSASAKGLEWLSTDCEWEEGQL